MSFYDTEFWERGPAFPITCISVGAVREDGAELYLINRDAPYMKIANESPWLRKNVLSQLPLTMSLEYDVWQTSWDTSHSDMQHVRPFSEIGLEFYRFVNHGPGEIKLCARWSAYDHVVISQLFGRMVDKPVNMPWYTHDLQQDIERLDNPPLPHQTDGLHNALADARFVKTCYDHLHCAHCGGTARGYAKVGDRRLCHPNEGVDCYHLVTVYKHEMPCVPCTISRERIDTQR